MQEKENFFLSAIDFEGVLNLKNAKFQRAKELAASCNRQPFLAQYLETAANGKTICPNCGSGTHGKGTPALEIYDDGHAFCFSCRKAIRNVDVAAVQLNLPVGKYSGAVFFEVVKKACEMCGVKYDVDEPSFSFSEIGKSARKDFEWLYKDAAAKLPGFISAQGGSWRGLTIDDLQAVSAGYNDYQGVRAIIFPYDSKRFFSRSINNDPHQKKFIGGGRLIYNPYKVLNCGRIILVVEGEIDALSIHKLGYPVIALGSAGNIKLLLKTLDAEFADAEDKPKFLFLFDNNDEGQGQKFAAEGVSMLLKAGYGAVNNILSPDRKFDANEFLQKDAAGFKTRLAEIYRQAEKEIAALEEELKVARETQRAENYGTSFFLFFNRKFADVLKRGKRFAGLKSGFSNLDKVQTEWERGLYVIGAPPSAGKTTFIWQLLEQMARQRDEFGKFCNHCVFISYEMTEFQMFSKSLARGLFDFYRTQDEYFEPDKDFLTAAKIRKGCSSSDLKKVLANFQKTEIIEILEKEEQNFVDLRFLDLSENPVDVDGLIAKMTKIAAEIPADEPLIFAIDYLQCIPNGNIKDNVRAAIDDTLGKLRQFTLKHDAIVFAVSSFNRSSYNAEMNFAALKESGCIEYSATVVWGLNLFVESKSVEDFKKAKMKQPRQMVLECIKNRLGNDYRICFEYYSAAEKFLETEDFF